MGVITSVTNFGLAKTLKSLFFLYLAVKMAEEIKRILFCQGDKKELEELTGEKFAHIRPPATFDADKEDDLEGNWPGELGPTFLISYTLRMPGLGDVEESLEEGTVGMLLEDMREKAIEVGADAVIHYTAHLTTRHDLYGGYSMGTPVRRKRFQ